MSTRVLELNGRRPSLSQSRVVFALTPLGGPIPAVVGGPADSRPTPAWGSTNFVLLVDRLRLDFVQRLIREPELVLIEFCPVNSDGHPNRMLSIQVEGPK